MFTALTAEEATPGAAVYFYMRPGDKQPTMETTVMETAFDRGKLFISAEGLEDWFPFYHFSKSASEIRYGCEITNPLDDLHRRLGI